MWETYAKEMADLLTISRATFFRKIKGLVIDQESKENKECEFCLRLGDVPPSPSVPALTDQMKEYIRNACTGHKYVEMARILEVKPDTLTKYINRKK